MKSWSEEWYLPLFVLVVAVLGIVFSAQDPTGNLVKTRFYPEEDITPTAIKLRWALVPQGGVLEGMVTPGEKGSDTVLYVYGADGLRHQKQTFCLKSGRTCWEAQEFEIRLLSSLSPGEYYVEVGGKSGIARAYFTVTEEVFSKRSNEF